LARNLTGQNEETVRKQVGPNAYFKRLPFDSSRKRMTTGMKVGNKDLLLMNGASEQILEACEAILNSQTNEITRLDQNSKNRITQDLEAMAGKGFRTVSIAYKEVDGQAMAKSTTKQSRSKDVLEEVEKSGFILLGVFGI